MTLPRPAAIVSTVTGDLDALLPELDLLYKDLHANPELSMRETRTAGEVAERLRAAGWEVHTCVGQTGVVGILRNGTGPTVALRADMDGLPIREETGLPYASTREAPDPAGNQVPVMHACGHDLHVTWLVGAATQFARHRDAWSGTLVALFQPAEETAAGAQAMLDAGVLDLIPRPDVVLGQHVDAAPAGHVNTRPGTMMAAAESLRIHLHGRGGHGSRPDQTVDPVVMAAAVIMRLQTIVARETPPAEMAVATVGSIHAGTKENIIPSEAELTVNVRAFSDEIRDRVVAAIRRIVLAEAAASGAPRDPDFTPIHSFPLTHNDPGATERVQAALIAELGEGQVREGAAKTGSEDFGRFGTAAGVPSVFWFVGVSDPALFGSGRRAPGSHTAQFAPAVALCLPTGVRTLAAAAAEWLGNP